MKIALLSPAGAMHRYTGSFKKAIHYAPLTMTSLASIIDDHVTAEIALYDETIEAIPLDIEADLIMITAITGTAPRSYRFADYYRSRGITVVLGGVHPTLLPEEAKAHADAVLIGFAELTVPRMIKDFLNRSLQHFYRADNQKSFRFAVPKRSLLAPGRYITNSSLEASRGCSNDCSFCAVNALYGQHFYRRDIDEIIADIASLNTKNILFVDVNLIADRNFALQLFKALIPLKKWWYGLTTADIVNDDELFKALVKSGCKGLLIGFEAVAKASLSAINKFRNKTVDYSEMMKKLHAAGIAVNGTFCFGTDGDDADVFERTVDMVEKLQIDLPRYSILTPFIGTPLYRQLAEQKRITDHNWAMYDVQHVVYQPKHMTQQQLMDGFVWAWRQTYSKKGIFRRIARPNLLLPLGIITNFAYRHYADRLLYFTRDKMIDNSDIPLGGTL